MRAILRSWSAATAHPTRSLAAFGVAVLLLLAPAPASLAQNPAARPNADSEAGEAASADTATLVLANQRVFMFRGALGASSAQERAERARLRILRLAEQKATDSVTLQATSLGILVGVGATPVLVVTQADVDTAGGETIESVAATAAGRLRVVLAAEIEQRSIFQILRAIFLSIVATLLFVLALRALVLARRWAMTHVPDPDRPGLPTLTVRGFTVLSAHQLLLFVRRLVDLMAWALGLFVAYVWLAYVLTRFAYSRPWGEALGGYLVETIRDLALGAVGAIPGLFTVVLIVIATRWIARIIGGFFQAVEAGSVDVPWVHPETANPTRRIVVVLLWLFAIVVSYRYLPGSQSGVFQGVTVFVGLLLTLGSTGIVNQAMSGLVLMYSRALKPGDYVRIGDTEGIVTTLGMLSTKIRTNKREEVTLPNAVVVAANVKNYTRLSGDKGVILHTTLTIGYDTPWRQVQALLIMAAERTTGLLKDPPPFVNKTALSDWYVEYQLNAYLSQPERRIRVLSELHSHIIDCFNEYGVQIMSPNYENDPPTPKLVPRSQWYAAPARPEGEAAAHGDGTGAAGGDGHPGLPDAGGAQSVAAKRGGQPLT